MREEGEKKQDRAMLREVEEEEMTIKRWLEGDPHVDRRREKEDMAVLHDLQRREHLFPFLYRDNRAMATLFSFWVLGERFYFKELESRDKSIQGRTSSFSSSVSLGERHGEDKKKNTESFSSCSSFSKIERDRCRDNFKNDVSLETRLELLVAFLFYNSSSSENESCYASSLKKKPFSSAYQEASLLPEEEVTENEIGFYVFEKACERVGCVASEAELLAAWEVLAGPQGGGSERKEERVGEKIEEERKRTKITRDSSSSLLQSGYRSVEGAHRREEKEKHRGDVIREKDGKETENEEGDRQREEERRRRGRHLEEVKQWRVSRAQILIRAKVSQRTFSLSPSR